MALNKVVDWLFGKLFNADNTTFHRQMLVIAKDANVGLSDVQRIISSAPAVLHTCALTHRTINAQISKPINLYKHVLGQSYDLAIYDATDEFRPSALLALAGTITHQGCLIIITPPLRQWPHMAVEKPPFYLTYGFEILASRYIEHLSKSLLNNEQIAIWQDDNLHLPETKTLKQEFTEPSIFWSQDQKQAFNKLKIFFDTQDRYAVIKAPRGRGKSSLLGLFSASQITQGYSVLVTSTAKRSVEGLFNICLENSQALAKSFPEWKMANDFSAIKWVAPDSPLLRDNDYDMLIIDEAASFPASQLLEICNANNKVVLSTTTEGYEGSGKGFDHKVMAELDKTCHLHHITLTQPLRWYENDPLEVFLSYSILFKEEAPEPSKTDTVNNVCCKLTRTEEVSNKELSQILQLLNGAHYQTTPDDLMRLVDSPDIYFALLKSEEGAIVAAAAINVEGGEKLSILASEISKGKRRLKGHLSAQGLVYFAARPELATMKYWRINRIAVKTELQGYGLGSQLLTFITNKASKLNVDAITSSFGVNKALLMFWKKNNFRLIRMGVKKNKASATGSALVSHPLSPPFKKQATHLSLLGFRDATHEKLDQALLAEFDVNPNDIICLEEIYLKRWEQFYLGSRNYTSLSSAIPWLEQQIKDDKRKGNEPEQETLLAFLNLLQKGKKVDRNRLASLKQVLEAYINTYQKF